MRTVHGDRPVQDQSGRAGAEAGCGVFAGFGPAVGFVPAEAATALVGLPVRANNLQPLRQLPRAAGAPALRPAPPALDITSSDFPLTAGPVLRFGSSAL